MSDQPTQPTNKNRKRRTAAEIEQGLRDKLAQMQERRIREVKASVAVARGMLLETLEQAKDLKLAQQVDAINRACENLKGAL